MTIRDKQLSALLAVLDGDTPNLPSLDRALTILGAHLRRQSKDRGLLFLIRRDERSLLLSGKCGLVHWADRMGDAIATIAGVDGSGTTEIAERHRDRTADGAIAIAPGSVRDDDGFIETDGGFRWPWSEVAPALAAAIRAIPTPKTRAVLCDACKKEFYR